MLRLSSTIVVVFSGLSILSAGSPGTTGAEAGRTALVEVDGTTFTLADLESKRPGSLFQAKNTYHEAQKKAADELVNDYLLERRAKKDNTTVTKLLEAETQRRFGKDPSEEALRVYYDGLDTKETFEAVREKIVDAIRQRRQAKAKDLLIASLRSEAKISFRVPQPRAEISLKDTPVRGPKDAPVMLVEYADYECPYCQQIQPAVDKLMADYKGRLSMAYKDVPLPMHANAQKAAEASHCAGSQGKYWEYHDVLAVSKDLQIPRLKEFARTLQLDGSAFDKCLDSGTHAELVKSQLAEAQALGLPGTPGFFVNGRFVTGGVSYEGLRQLVEEELAAAKKSGAAR